jgi:hypothetical protein
MHFGNEISVVVVSSTASGDNDYGDTTVTEVRTTVERVLYAPRSSTERTDPHSPAVLTAASLYFLAGVTLDADDAIEITGVHPLVDGVYEVEGRPGYWGRLGDVEGVEVAVNRVSAA